jgi:CheY-like chemotaxis protein
MLVFAQNPNMAPPRVLLIEDDASDVFLMRRALLDQDETFVFETLVDGEQALRFVSDQRKNIEGAEPCVIVLDLHLPRHDGFEVLRAIRDEPALKHIKVVAMTSYATPQEEARLRLLGADYRLKPSGLPEFADLAHHLIGICKGSPGL